MATKAAPPLQSTAVKAQTRRRKLPTPQARAGVCAGCKGAALTACLEQARGKALAPERLEEAPRVGSFLSQTSGVPQLAPKPVGCGHAHQQAGTREEDVHLPAERLFVRRRHAVAYRMWSTCLPRTLWSRFPGTQLPTPVLRPWTPKAHPWQPPSSLPAAWMVPAPPGRAWCTTLFPK